MADQHWFDTWHRTLTKEAPRRGLLRSVGALTVALVLGATPGTASAKGKKNNGKGKKNNGKGKNNHHDKGKGKPKSQPSGNCSDGACAVQWPDDTANRDFCEVKCGHCEKAGTNFCIVEGDYSDPAKIATCCHRGDECCAGARGGECCGPPNKCCAGVGCISAELSCCPDDSRLGTCFPGETCCPGVGCINTYSDRSHCGGCGIACPSGQPCVGGACVPAPTPTCPTGTDACGGPSVWEAEHCCERAACFACTAYLGTLPQCVYRCSGDQVCVDDGGTGVCM